ncbi:ribokinase [Paenibacillus swuensis]|uniref:Deoxyribokinase n=2 Tax=Paenibacillus swuensis TaxID=1178515 RepID=A0A172TNV9_9BACL|nr:ribokinase [Paenibacillus swuensis]
MDLVVSMQRMPKTGETVMGEGIHTIPGGKGANQAIGCAKLGAQVTMIGAVGEDGFGDAIVRQMEKHGIATDTIARLTDTSTGTATIFHTPEDNCIVIVPGANGHCTPASIEGYISLIQGADLVLVQLEIPLETVREALKLAREAGVATVLNPAPARELPVELLGLADYITPNETEFEALTGEAYASEEALEAGMRCWQEANGPKLLVTRGKLGVSFLEQAEGGLPLAQLRTVPAPVVDAVDTTGAGDAFNAAFSYCVASGHTLESAVSFAVKAASLSVTRFGAQDGMPTLEEVSIS